MSFYEDISLHVLPDNEVRTRVYRSLEDRSRSSRHLSSRQKERVESLVNSDSEDLRGADVARLVIATEDPHYREIVRRQLSPELSKFPTVMTPAQESAMARVNAVRRSLNLGVLGTLLSSFLDPTIVGWSGDVAPSPVYDLARKVRTTQQVAKINSFDLAMGFAAESSAAGDDSPTGHPTAIPVHRADAFLPLSAELDQDWAGFAAQLGEMVNAAYRRMLGTALTTGTGTNEPTGILTSTAAESSPAPRQVATSAQIAADDLYGAFEALPQAARESASCAWMSSTSVATKVGKLAADDPAFDLRVGVDRRGVLLGRPYVPNDVMPGMPATSTTDGLVLIGDFAHYAVVEHVGTLLEYVPNVIDSTNNRPTGQRGYFAWARVGGGVINPNAFRLIKNQ